MAGCSLLIGSGALVGLIRQDWLAIVLLGVMALGTAAFMANYFAFCQEVSGRHTGLVVGILGGLGNLFVAGFLPFAGRVKDVSGSFAGIFLIVGLLPFVGLGALWIGWRAGPGRRESGLDAPRRFCQARRWIRSREESRPPSGRKGLRTASRLHPGPHMRW